MTNIHSLCKHHSTSRCSLSKWHTLHSLHANVLHTLIFLLFFVLRDSSYHVPLVRQARAPVGPLVFCRRRAVHGIGTGIAFPPHKGTGVVLDLLLLFLYGWLCGKESCWSIFLHVYCAGFLQSKPALTHVNMKAVCSSGVGDARVVSAPNGENDGRGGAGFLYGWDKRTFECLRVQCREQDPKKPSQGTSWYNLSWQKDMNIGQYLFHFQFETVACLTTECL